MKTLCASLLLLSSGTSFAQRLELSLSGGGTWNIPANNSQYTFWRHMKSRVNAFGAAELRFNPIRKLTVGCGFSAERLSTGIGITVNAVNGLEGKKKTLPVYAGKPALTAYLLVGTQFSKGKYSIHPELIGGFVQAKSGRPNDESFSYGDGSGSMVGAQLLVKRKLGRHLSAGIRTGIRYFTLAYEHSSERSRTLSVPFGATVSVAL